MKHLKWQFLLGAGLICLSAIIYFTHFLIFRDAHHIWIYLLGDIAFVPIEVLLVSLIIHRALEASEKKARLEKVNMVIEAFFSEIGLNLLKVFHDLSSSRENTVERFEEIGEWDKPEFAAIRKKIVQSEFDVDAKVQDLNGIRDFLEAKRGFLLRLWENPHVLEHESYSEVLRATLHLTEELIRRDDLSSVTETDLKHLRGDMNRAFYLLTYQWIDYMLHLKINFPYLYSLAVRINPFSRSASPYVLT